MRVAIIGFGRFGRLLAQILKDDFEVVTFSADHAQAGPGESAQPVPLEEALRSEVIFYAVPINDFESVLSSHLPLLKSLKKLPLLIDVLSVKLLPKNVFERLLPAEIHAILTHPMFGPDSVRVQGLAGQRIVMDRFTASDREYAFWKEYFSRKELKVIELAADEHDRLAANSQGLAHFIGRVLDEMKIEATAIDTLGAQKLLEVREQTCNDSWELFSGLQAKNPYTLSMRVRLGAAVDRVYAKLLPNRLHKERMVVGIQGGRGSFNEEAAGYYLRRSDERNPDVRYLYTTRNVLRALHEGEVDRGQFAIHNSLGGVVEESIEAMADHKYRIVEQFSIKIAHALMIHPEAKLDEVDTIMTHPQVLRQCKRSLSEKYGRFKLTSGEGDLIDHANVASHLSQRRLPLNIATMGSRILAEIYGLRIVEDNLQDLQENYTSFLWVERPS